MTVSELRTLVDNLDEYIHIPGGIDKLKKMVLHLAVSGQLVPQDPSEGTGEELYRQIQAEKAELVKQGKLKKQKPLPKIESDDLLPGIPVSWTQVKIGDVSIYQQRGKSPKYTTISSYPVVSQKCVRWNSIDWQHVKFITPESIEKYEEFRLLRDGDLLLNSTGTGTMGRVGIYRENKQYDRVVADSHVTVVRFSDFISSGFAHIFFRSPYVQEGVESKASGSTNQIEWNLSSIQNEIMPLPPLSEQKRIVAKVDSIFALIDQLAEVYKSEQAERSKLVVSSLAQLAKAKNDVEDSLALTHLSEIIRTKVDAKILRQTIFHLAVSGQLVPQDPSEGTGEELYRKIQDEKAELVKQGKIKKHSTLSEVSDDEIPYVIPTSWKWVRQADVFDITSSKRVMQSDWKKSGIPFLRARDLTAAIKTNEISSDIFVSQDYFDSVKKISGAPQPGDLMVSGVGTIGTPYIVKDGDEFYFKDATILWFKNFSNVNSKFMKQVLLSGYMKKKVKSQSQGTTVDTYTIANARMNIVPLPPLAEQKRIVAKTTKFLDLITELEKHMEK